MIQDIQEQIQHGGKAYTSTKAKPGSILAILEGVAQEEQQEKEQQEQQGKQAQQEKQPIQENQDAILPIQTFKEAIRKSISIHHFEVMGTLQASIWLGTAGTSRRTFDTCSCFV